MADASTRTTITPHPDAERVLTPEAVAFIVELHDRFGGRRTELLAARAERQRRFDAGERPDFLPETAEVRSGDWKVDPAPAALADRRVEITGPVERKMMINALNSGAKAFMADLEDANSPTWANVVTGQVNLQDAVRRTISLTAEQSGSREYKLNDEIATLLVRPRGWHLPERHLLVDGEPISGSLFDFGLYVFHNAAESLSRGAGPFFYLPKLEGHLEARLWNDVMTHAEEALGIPVGSIRATVLIETITAAFEMDEIIYELRPHITGLNAGRWDYIFSVAKRFATDPSFTLPDRSQVTMTSPFMRAYTELLVQTCHKRGAHAIGGMSAFIPNTKKPEVTEAALAKLHDDKKREAGDGFDGTWVAHPGMVKDAMQEFDAVLGDRPNQLDRQRPEVRVTAADLLTVEAPEGSITRAGLETNISVGIRYLASWMSGAGAVGIDDLMEDAATAEISRAQIWQWIRHGRTLADGTPVTEELVRRMTDEKLGQLVGDGLDQSLLEAAREVFDEVAFAKQFPTFLTLPAYERLP